LPAGAVVVAACWWVQQWRALPTAAFCICLMAIGLAGMLLARPIALRRWRRRAWSCRWAWSRRRIRSRPLGARALASLLLLSGIALLATGWAGWRAQQGLAQRLSPALEGVELTVLGFVDEMPIASRFGWRARFQIESCEPVGGPCPGPVAVRLNWPLTHAAFDRAGSAGGRTPLPGTAPIAPGERWRISVRLKRPLAAQNPLLFDAELRSLQEGIAASGSVRSGPRAAHAPQRLEGSGGWPGSGVERLRTRLRDAMALALRGAAEPVRGVLIALVVGDQSAIPGPFWELFNRTGVGHLMSISGLHITMLAGLGAWAVRRLWRAPIALPAFGRQPRRPLAALLSAPHAAWCAGVGVAFAYSALAGWGLPAQRTCWMLAAAGLALASGRARSTRDVLCTAAAIVCVADPWAPMAAGFWLSFAAVAAIVWHGSRFQPVSPGAASASLALAPRASWLRVWLAPRLAEAGRTQVAATVSLLPLGILFFSSVSLISPLANAFAIPLVSGVITPLALAGGVLTLLPLPLGSGLLMLTAECTGWLLRALAACDAGSWAAVGVPAPGVVAVLIGAAACAVLLAPWPIPGRAWAGAGLLPLLLSPVATPRPDELWLTALDVGQGMAVLVETAEGRLLYDTGPSYGQDNDAGARVLAPYLRARGITRLQAMVVSHRDTDHSGGALSLLRQWPVDWVGSSLEAAHPVVLAAPRHHPCQRGEQWQWGGVGFEWLHPGGEPAPARAPSANARSCVLRIVAPAATVLLAGDIEAAQESRLMALFGPRTLRADVLLAPHHGSATSSSPAFLAAVAPRWAVFQVGYRNRFGHPAARVLQRYQQAGVGILRSDHDGAITIRLRAGHAPVIERARRDSLRYWRLAGNPGQPEPSDPTVTASPEPTDSGPDPGARPDPVAGERAQSATGRSSRRPPSRPRRAPGRRTPSTGTPPDRRAAEASRSPPRAASRTAGPPWPPARSGRPGWRAHRSAFAPAGSAPNPDRSRCR
jgi:competence protein ComEC